MDRAAFYFQCIVIRRTTALNCPWILNKPRLIDCSRTNGGENNCRSKQEHEQLGLTSRQHRFDDFSVIHPSEERYSVSVSEGTSSDDFRRRLQDLSGIDANNLQLFLGEQSRVVAEQAVTNEGTCPKQRELTSVVSRELKIVLHLYGKELLLGQLIAQQEQSRRRRRRYSNSSEFVLVAFETTLSEQPTTEGNEEEIGDIDYWFYRGGKIVFDRKEKMKRGRADLERRELERLLEVYGGENECRLFDTDPFPIAKAVSRSLWPRTESELKVGLRVDAKDCQGNWFPGSVVGLVQQQQQQGGVHSKGKSKIRVRIRFDNFSSKMDRVYTMEHFKEGEKVCPLYSQTSRDTITTKPKPMEFIVRHRYKDKTSQTHIMFGQPFYVQCHREWSTARAGAHILAQAAKFLQRNPDYWAGDDTVRVESLYRKVHTYLSNLIDVFVDFDREYIQQALGLQQNHCGVIVHHSDDNQENCTTERKYRNPTFDATALSSEMEEKTKQLLRRLPLEIRVCTTRQATLSPLADAGGAQPTPGNVQALFPFSLTRTIGNYMNVHCMTIVLQWKEPPRINKKTGEVFFHSPVMYVEPHVYVDPNLLVATSNSNNSNSGHSRTKKDNNNHENNGNRNNNSSYICPICFEETLHIVQIPHPHWDFNTGGDITGHHMCKQCSEQYNKNECPFCRASMDEVDMQRLGTSNLRRNGSTAQVLHFHSSPAII